MIQIRQNCFETNSSSSHSLVISKKDNGRYTPEEAYEEISWSMKDGWWELPRGTLNFGRAPFRVLSSFEEKLRYVFAHTPYRRRPSKRHPEYDNYSAQYWRISRRIQKIIPEFKGIRVPRNTACGTDDQCLWGWLSRANITLEEFLFNKSIVVICDGDEYCIWSDMKRLGLVSKDNIKLALPEREWWEEE